jgi:hypothetical protein
MTLAATWTSAVLCVSVVIVSDPVAAQSQSDESSSVINAIGGKGGGLIER